MDKIARPVLSSLVDASFFALGLIRCPWLWEHLDDSTKQQVVIALKTTRNTVPVRSINTDGSFPVTGRSITYRGGAFHHLADIALRKQLPASLHPAQVRSALTAVIKKTLEAPSTFTKDGWLNIGLYGSQPDMADFYINIGSAYLCANIFLPLGLADTDDFWSSPAQPWTAVKVWSGQNVWGDYALEIK